MPSSLEQIDNPIDGNGRDDRDRRAGAAGQRRNRVLVRQIKRNFGLTFEQAESFDDLVRDVLSRLGRSAEPLDTDIARLLSGLRVFMDAVAETYDAQERDLTRSLGALRPSRARGHGRGAGAEDSTTADSTIPPDGEGYQRSLETLRQAARRLSQPQPESGVPSLQEPDALNGRLDLEEIARVMSDLVDNRERVERILMAREARFRALAENSFDLIALFDIHGTITYISPSVQRILGYEPAELIGTDYTLLIHPLDQEAVRHYVTGALASGMKAASDAFEARARHRDGSYRRLLSDFKNCLDDPAVAGVVINARDVTRERDAQESVSRQQVRLEYLANHDSLTGLYNRHYLKEALRQALAAAAQRQSRFAILLVDLDQFKAVNDTLGHDAGDDLLRRIARRLTTVVRGGDRVVRLGGDEFIIIISEVQDEHAVMRVADKLLRELARPVEIKGQPLVPSASIGVAVYPEHGGDAATLLKHADIAMFASKSLGRHNVQFYAPELKRETEDRYERAEQLKWAVRNGELELFYQPQIALRTRRVTGFEALLRWRHPRLGLLSPGDFLPLAEESGALGGITEWVIATACRQISAWVALGIELPVAVNVPAQELRMQRLGRLISACLRTTGAPPGLLEVEITETALVLQDAATRAMLKELNDIGVRLVLDDFGAGYSGLHNLKHLPLAVLKVDRSFVEGLPGDSRDAVITRAVIEMGQGLPVIVLAEGVETAEQARFLTDAGCDCAQGYFFAKPMLLAELEEWLKQPLPEY